MKRIISSGLLSLAALAVIVGGTGAFFSDTETSEGNVFTSGSIDLLINHSNATYNGETCGQDCDVVDGAQNLLTNGSFEEDVVTDNGGSHEFFESISGWEKVNGTFVELQRDAFTSADGEQHLELDGDGADSVTEIEQTFNTTPGQRYQLSFEHSPRPESEADDSQVNVAVVTVVSDTSTPLPDTIVTGSSAINWETATYEFVATDSQTTLRFSQGGTANTYGGLVDNVSVLEMSCTDGEYSDTPGGFCELWESKDLTSESFFDFADVKPQDEGTNRISMTVEDNESYICLAVDNKENVENDLNGAEDNAGDTTQNEGELGDFLQVMGWYSDGFGNTSGTAFGPTAANDLDVISYADSSNSSGVAPGTTQYLETAWCLGTLTDDGNGNYSCDGNVVDINQTQTDEFTADLQFHAIQTRNNEGFTCEGYLAGASSDSGNDEIGCTEEADVMLVLDSSGSVGSDMGTLKTAAKNFVDALQPSAGGVEVGVVDFDGSGTLVQGLTGSSTAAKNAIDTLVASGQTYLDLGIATAQEELDENGRANANDFILIVSDGDANNENAAATEAAASRNAGVTIFAVGVGGNIDASFLEQDIVTQPANEHYFSATDFEELQDQFNNILSCPVD